MAEIVVKNLSKHFGDFTAVQSSSFTVKDGEFFMLLGPSGCGKTTTLRMIAGLELPSSGEIYLDGEEVSQWPASKRDIAFVFQMFALYPHMNVRQNIAYPLRSQGWPRAQVKSKVDEIAGILGIEHLLKQPVSGLAGGDRQRVALGRAIVRSPKAFMMDEPIGALDSEFREYMAEELRALHERMGATTVYVTHDQLEAMQLGDKIVIMNQGIIEQFGAPQEIYDKPASIFVADFIGSPAMNFLDFEAKLNAGAKTVMLGEHSIKVPTLTETASGALALGIRPEHIEICSDTSAYRGRVLACEYLGSSQIISVNCAHGSIKIRAEADSPVQPGDNIGLRFNSERISLFDRASGKALRSSLHAAE